MTFFGVPIIVSSGIAFEEDGEILSLNAYMINGTSGLSKPTKTEMNDICPMSFYSENDTGNIFYLDLDRITWLPKQ